MGYYDKRELVNNNSVWIPKQTLTNMNMIYDFFVKKRSQSKNQKHFRLTFSQISKGTGINRHQVRFAVMQLAFMLNPFMRIHALFYPDKDGSGKVCHKVELLREVENKQSGNPDA